MYNTPYETIRPSHFTKPTGRRYSQYLCHWAHFHHLHRSTYLQLTRQTEAFESRSSTRCMREKFSRDSCFKALRWHVWPRTITSGRERYINIYPNHTAALELGHQLVSRSTRKKYLDLGQQPFRTILKLHSALPKDPSSPTTEVPLEKYLPQEHTFIAEISPKSRAQTAKMWSSTSVVHTHTYFCILGNSARSATTPGGEDKGEKSGEAYPLRRC